MVFLFGDFATDIWRTIINNYMNANYIFFVIIEENMGNAMDTLVVKIHNNQEDPSNSFCKGLQCSLIQCHHQRNWLSLVI